MKANKWPEIVDILKLTVVLRRLMYFTGTPEADMGNQCSAEKGISSAIFCWLALTLEIDFPPPLCPFFSLQLCLQVSDPWGFKRAGGCFRLMKPKCRVSEIGTPGSYRHIYRKWASRLQGWSCYSPLLNTLGLYVNLTVCLLLFTICGKRLVAL